MEEDDELRKNTEEVHEHASKPFRLLVDAVQLFSHRATATTESSFTQV